MNDNVFLEKEFYLDKIDNSWKDFFNQEKKSSYFFPLLEKLVSEYKNYRCWPSKENVFRLFREISLEELKIIILGQDPYHLPEIADGIAFSTQKKGYIPASLKNIFRELRNNFNCAWPIKGDLLMWVKEGVFLLNVALTVRDGKPLSHMNFWREFIFSLLIYLNRRDEKLIWVFLGQKAKKISEECSIKSNYVLVTTHPSPYSAESKEGFKKNNVVYFIGSQIFVKINKLLIDLGRKEINWLAIFNIK